MNEVDLRPMTLGEVLDRTFKLYKSNFWLFAGITAMPLLVSLVINVGAAGMGINQRKLVGSIAASPGMLFSIIGGAVVFLVVYLFLLGAAQAATVFAVSDLYLGRTPSLRES